MQRWLRIAAGAMVLGLTACRGAGTTDRTTPLPRPATQSDVAATAAAEATAPPSEVSSEVATGPSAPPGETSAAPSPERQAKAAYQKSWDFVFKATSSDPPEEVPGIRKTLTGEALSETLAAIGQSRQRGEQIEGSMQTHPVVQSATANEVVLDDCSVKNSVTYDADGEHIDVADDVRFHLRVRVVKEAGTWKVARLEQIEPFNACTPR